LISASQAAAGGGTHAITSATAVQQSHGGDV
jgi:hypothetical protein